ncbi:hypothetical protein P168DRAFT_258083 [Aspergillus campestris IBT 28561]|uniref:F-box domain-containing protein n=1 Tax=Aspergillus campestris (strain IBT 28561) TaxID=1392248 RepID=A0A2I1CV57_ASPC2|nr:uncharacterized protein P168DRAFT_258083 [Aspergillus campestris IBT 28561]PKY01506.1 hypothetical protein P168DRAFT_258083 [Aspergillus campestris IBT 28561]
MTFPLPGDVIYIILDILGDEKDYNSLYQCAVSSRCFTEHALAVLYKLHNTSPVKGGGTEDEQFKTRRSAPTWMSIWREQEVVIQKWALMWRSILLSTIDQTYLPYHSYIRYLDLDDLSYLLGNAMFKGRIKENFFTEELIDLASNVYESKGSKRLRSSRTLAENERLVIKFGSAIVRKTNSLREMSCNIPPSVLSSWLEDLPLLQAMTIWSGTALTQHAGNQIRSHCPDFKQLTIYAWKNESSGNAESESQEFLNELAPNTLQYFEVLSYSQLGPRSIKALNNHLESLTELKLTSLPLEAIAALPSLATPPALRVLVLTDSRPAVRDEGFYAVIVRVAEWIRGCKALRRLELRRFVDDAALLSHVLTDENLRLSTLSLAGYTMAGARGFHEALASQPSLQNLYLRGESSESPEDNELLVQAIGQLNGLRELELKDISDCFTPDHLITLTPYLPHLERLWVSGDFFNDEVWDAFRGLGELQSLVIHALSEFTTQGIIDFIASLKPGNKGFSLSILNSTTDTDITEGAQNRIREILKTRLDGTFDFGLAQEEYSDADTDDEIFD